MRMEPRVQTIRTWASFATVGRGTLGRSARQVSLTTKDNSNTLCKLIINKIAVLPSNIVH